MKVFGLIALFLTMLCWSSESYGQITLQGKVIDEQENAVTFATLTLRQEADSVNVLQSVVSDNNGEYKFERCKEGRYILTIMSINCETLSQGITLRRPMTGTNLVVKEFRLKTASKQIDEIVVEGSSITHNLGSTTYNIMSNDKKFAKSTLDLLSKIPQLNVDLINNEVTSVEGNLTVFINGVAASAQELVMYDKKEIKKIEYYNLPPMKYGGVVMENKVVNIITEPLDSGVYLGAELTQAVTSEMTFGNAFARYNKGQHQLSLKYDFNFHTLYNSENTEYMKYDIAQDKYSISRDILGRSKAENNKLSLQYQNNAPDKYVFQAILFGNYNESNNGTSIMNNYIKNEVLTRRIGGQDMSSQVLSPTAYVYYYRQLPKRNEMTLAAVGTYFNAKSGNTINEYLASDAENVYFDMQEINNDKYSFNAQAMYTKQFDKWSVSVSETFTGEWLNSKVINTNDSNNNRIDVLNNYLGVNITGKAWDKFTYSGEAYLFNRKATTNSNSESENYVIGYAILGYNVSKSTSLQFIGSRMTRNPTLSQINDQTATPIYENVIGRGNSGLKSYTVNTFQLGLTNTYKWINSYINLAYQYNDKPINYYYREAQGFIEYIPMNDKKSELYNINYGVTLSPFDGKLMIRLNSGVSYVVNDTELYGKVSQLTIPFNYQIRYNWKNFSVYYNGWLSCTVIQSSNIVTDPMGSTIGVMYNYKNFVFRAGCSNFIFKPIQTSRTIDNSVFQSTSRTFNRGTYNNVTLSIQYTFGSGSLKNASSEKEIGSFDTDSGL